MDYLIDSLRCGSMKLDNVKNLGFPKHICCDAENGLVKIYWFFNMYVCIYIYLQHASFGAPWTGHFLSNISCFLNIKNILNITHKLTIARTKQRRLNGNINVPWALNQCCQIEYYQTKNYNLGIFWSVLQ
jgi:hypothetical protein